MFEELNKIIEYIEKVYSEVLDEWIKKENYLKINMKRTLVRDLNKDSKEKAYILSYRQFLNDRSVDLTFKFKNINLKSDVDSRVKTLNSTEDKIKRYVKEHNDGEIPINKCFNDLFGIRIILEEFLDYEDIKEFVLNSHNKANLKLKCNKSDKQEYIATHIYFSKDNFSFPWELQIWSKQNSKTNYLSHEKYKQDYAKWEQQNKEEK